MECSRILDQLKESDGTQGKTCQECIVVVQSSDDKGLKYHLSGHGREK